MNRKDYQITKGIFGNLVPAVPEYEPLISEQALLWIDMEARYTSWKLDDVAAAKSASDHDLRRIFSMVYNQYRKN